jgi:mannosyltransferase OCH1-like enzyme
MIPKILHRTLPAKPRPEVEAIWGTVLRHTEGWEHRTYQSPRDPNGWPLTGGLFERCADGAMNANLVRLEALWVHGGVYVDSDVSLVRPLEPLLHTGFFIGWESEKWLGTAVIGAVPGHPAVRAALDAMSAHVRTGSERSTSPRVLTPVLKGRGDVTLLPRKTFYPVPYLVRDDRQDWSADAAVYAVHHWHGSWVRTVD